MFDAFEASGDDDPKIRGAALSATCAPLRQGNGWDGMAINGSSGTGLLPILFLMNHRVTGFGNVWDVNSDRRCFGTLACLLQPSFSWLQTARLHVGPHSEHVASIR